MATCEDEREPLCVMEPDTEGVSVSLGLDDGLGDSLALGVDVALRVRDCDGDSVRLGVALSEGVSDGEAVELCEGDAVPL